jgi:Cof subfamily protein (haloacid dehalogenase superfamily)
VSGRIRWIVTDLDGTLVGADLRIVQRSRAALERFRDSGGEVILATGRNEVSTDRYHKELNLSSPAILYNGARVVDLAGAKVLYANDIGSSYRTLNAAVIEHLPDAVGAVAFVDGDPVVVHDAPVLEEYARRDGLTLLRGASAPDRGSVIKVLLVNDRPELAELAAAVSSACPDLVTVASEPTYLEVLAPRASKGAALRWLAARHDVDLTQVAAIGDNHNDLDMILAAGIGAAPAGANPDVRAMADLVLGTCADGAVADLVEYVMGLDGNGPIHDAAVPRANGPVTQPGANGLQGTGYARPSEHREEYP